MLPALALRLRVRVLLALLAAAAVCLLATPAVRKFACKIGAMDMPGESRRVHDHPIPRLGGLALFAAGFLLYAVFNAVFLPSFYANGYKVGVAFVKAIIPTTLAMIVFEALPHVPGLMWLDDMDAATQVRLLPVLIGSILIYVGCMALTFQASARAYEKVDM